jgi:hypothetical protein
MATPVVPPPPLSTPPQTERQSLSDDSIYADPSSGPFLLFVFMSVFLVVCMFIIVMYLLKSQKDYEAKMNAMRKDKGRRTERVTDRTVFDFHHSPEEAEILETHERVMAAFNLDDDPHEAMAANPLSGVRGKKKDAGSAKKVKSPFEL